MGLEPVKSVIQVDSMDMELRVALWNTVYMQCFSSLEFEPVDPINPESHVLNHFPEPRYHPFFVELWVDFYGKPVDELPESWDDYRGFMKEHFFGSEWYSVYDLVEFVAHRFYAFQGFVEGTDP